MEVNPVRALLHKILAVLRDNALPGIAAIVVIVGLIGGYVTGALQWLVEQIPLVLDFLITDVTFKLWVLIAFAIPIIISVFSLGRQAYRRRRTPMRTVDYIGPSAAEFNVPADHKLAYGVLWRWPFAGERLDQWTPRCPFHGVTVDIFTDKYDPNDGSGTHRMYHFQCRGPEKGDPHTITGPEYDESYTGTLRGDVYDRLKGDSVRSAS